jgi:hypothetical protein
MPTYEHVSFYLFATLQRGAQAFALEGRWCRYMGLITCELSPLGPVTCWSAQKRSITIFTYEHDQGLFVSSVLFISRNPSHGHERARVRQTRRRALHFLRIPKDRGERGKKLTGLKLSMSPTPHPTAPHEAMSCDVPMFTRTHVRRLDCLSWQNAITPERREPHDNARSDEL